MKPDELSDRERSEERPDAISEPETEAAGATDPGEVLAGANRDIRNGLLWCGGGILLSFLSYYMAVEGGRYFVATGAVIWGAVQALRGFFARASELRRRGDRDGVLRTVGAAVAAAAGVALLATASYRFVHADDAVFEAGEQLYENDSPKVRFVVPAGYSPLERTDEPETDENYAYHRMHSYDSHTAVGLELVGLNPADGITVVDELLDGLRGQDSTFFDAGLLCEPELVELGGKRMLRRIGRREPTPGVVTVTYDLVHDNALVTFFFYYEGSAADPERVERGDALAAALELE